MTGIEYLRAYSKEQPGDDASMSIDTAVVLIQDRWTDADTQKCGRRCRLAIFRWARQIERTDKPYDRENEECLYCRRLVREHTLDQQQECGIKSDGLAFDGSCFRESEQQQAVRAFMYAQVCACGKKLGEHTWKEVKACNHSQASSQRGILERNLICPGPTGRGFSPEELRAMEHEYVEFFREDLKFRESFLAIPGLTINSPIETSPDLPHRVIPPEEIPRMEHGFVETFREWLELSPWLRNEPFTEEEQRELDRVVNSCNCQATMHYHAFDCPVVAGLIALAKKIKPRITAAQKAQQAAYPCPTCGKLIGQHSDEQTQECADKAKASLRNVQSDSHV